MKVTFLSLLCLALAAASVARADEIPNDYALCQSCSFSMVNYKPTDECYRIVKADDAPSTATNMDCYRGCVDTTTFTEAEFKSSCKSYSDTAICSTPISVTEHADVFTKLLKLANKEQYIIGSSTMPLIDLIDKKDTIANQYWKPMAIAACQYSLQMALADLANGGTRWLETKPLYAVSGYRVPIGDATADNVCFFIGDSVTREDGIYNYGADGSGKIKFFEDEGWSFYTVNENCAPAATEAPPANETTSGSSSSTTSTSGAASTTAAIALVTAFVASLSFRA